MITPHIAQLLEDNSLGTFARVGNETGNPLIFSEKLPAKKYGLYLVSRGSTRGRNMRLTQSFDIYARGKDDVTGADQLEAILDFFDSECYPQCSLPSVDDYSDATYKNCIIVPTSSVENVGVDETDRVIYVVSAQITYSKEIL